jgi:DMSO/TMAO reductase YedYZ molybdopterin-dependent catalytic subunit
MRNFPVIMIFLLLLLAGCLSGGESENIRQLQAAEVRGYQGENLSSIGDFRENSIKGPQFVDISSYRLMVSGMVENPLSYSYSEVLSERKYSKVVTLHCVEGWSVRILWEGVLLKDLLKDAGIRPEADTVIFRAYDGYTTSLPLDYIINNNIMIAYKMNNVTLPPERGFPFQLVAEDKWGYKWIKWITDIEISDDSAYRGYWERRGYSNIGDLNGPKFE